MFCLFSVLGRPVSYNSSLVNNSVHTSLHNTLGSTAADVYSFQFPSPPRDPRLLHPLSGATPDLTAGRNAVQPVPPAGVGPDLARRGLRCSCGIFQGASSAALADGARGSRTVHHLLPPDRSALTVPTRPSPLGQLSPSTTYKVSSAAAGGAAAASATNPAALTSHVRPVSSPLASQDFGTWHALAHGVSICVWCV